MHQHGLCEDDTAIVLEMSSQAGDEHLLYSTRHDISPRQWHFLLNRPPPTAEAQKTSANMSNTKPTVCFSHSTKPAAEAEPDHIHIIPDHPVYLRKCKVWIPVQVFDIINARLSPTTTTASYRKLPYKALIQDVSSITSYRVAPEIVAEIHEIRCGRPGPPLDATKDDKEKWEAERLFDQAMAERVILQRERVAAALHNLRLEKKANARNGLSRCQKTRSQRVAEAEQALKEAQIRAMEAKIEAERIWDEAHGIMDEDDGQEVLKGKENGMESALLSPPDSQLKKNGPKEKRTNSPLSNPPDSPPLRKWKGRLRSGG